MSPSGRNHYIYRTPFGPITIGASGDSISRVHLGARDLAGERSPSTATNECASQLLEYFAGKRYLFDVPLMIEGTAFQKSVWEQIRTIPYGCTCTPTEVAQMMGNPRAHRSVGQAVNSNPLAILIPAHRVVPANGRIEPHDPNAQLRAAFRTLERRASARNRA